MKRIHFDPLLLGIGFFAIVLLTAFVGMTTANGTEIQVVTNPPAWEYAALAYDGDTAVAFTGDLAANNEINKIYDAMNPDTMTSISVMNVLGERGWEYIDYQPGSPVVYMFRKPLR